jgi:steroid 5-alpha reductase family enzyme
MNSPESGTTQDPSGSSAASLLQVVAIVVVGLLLGLAGSSGGLTLGGVAIFVLCGLLAFVVNWAVFVPSFRAQTEHFFDLTGSLTYASVVIFAVAASWSDTTSDARLRSVLLAVLVLIWAGRLGSFLFARIKRDGRDGRFDELKVDFGKFLMTWTLQGLWVFFTLAAALVAITAGGDEPLGWIGWVGAAVWVVGFAIEVVADRQKSAFRADPANDGRFITTGLWAWSRHPNYFGEITLWAGIAIIAAPTMSGWRWVGLISPVFVLLLLTRVSGIPMLESRAKKRWGDEPEFQAYKKNTPALVLRPPRR